MDAYLLAAKDDGFSTEYDDYEEYLLSDPAATTDEMTYWEQRNILEKALVDAEDNESAAQDLENQALELAANKDVGLGVIAALWELLE